MRSSALVFVIVCGALVRPQGAGAADIPVKAGPRVAAIPAAYDWSGWSVGGNLGYGSGNADWTNRQSDPATSFFDALPGDTFLGSMSGMIAGVQIGYDRQFGQWVYGLEAMLNASMLKDGWTSRYGAADDLFKAQIDTLVSATGRIGYAWDNFLLYGKAGIAFVKVKASVTDSIAPTTGAGSDSNWRTGPAVGIGIAYGITSRVSLAVEYDYIPLPSGSHQLGGGAGTYLWDLDAGNVSQVIGRLNFRMN